MIDAPTIAKARPRPQVMTMTDAARARVEALMSAKGPDSAGLKVGVKKGGCAGMEYTMSLVDKVERFDEVEEVARPASSSIPRPCSILSARKWTSRPTSFQPSSYSITPTRRVRAGVARASISWPRLQQSSTARVIERAVA